MAEGDTIYRAAERLRPTLAGAALVRFEAPRLVGTRPWPGTTIDDVEAHGKHLLIHFDGGLSLRTHLRMNGSWHLYRAGERWRKPAHLARVVIEVDTGWVAVCFSAPVVETYRRAAGARAMAGLGPDLCRAGSLEPAVLATVLARVALADPATEVADALLDQQIAAGIGNVFKSEVCFAVGLEPFTPLGELGDDARRELWATAARQLQANLGPGPRRTHPRGLAVYGRAGRRCYTCGTPIRTARQGLYRRVTYWCPRCQLRPG
ncbi:MAG TPA: DNA-formamidopyrimidine glycosylase family protein [Ilumatobacter sp.]|nr:DNA-formamidopyrimidine glycosylase family protein [Ilumatobacter sp.]